MMKSKSTGAICGVAPREGSVDRNLQDADKWFLIAVASREGSVDRNSQLWTAGIMSKSLPARGAWIEMCAP